MKKLIKKITKAFAPDSPMWQNRCGGCLFANHTKTYCYKKHQQICYWDVRCSEYRENG